jgi:FkbM family methyltransferase
METIRKIIKLLQIIFVPRFFLALFTKQVAAAVEHIPVLKGLDCKFVVDIGANAGQFALAARRCFPDAEIHSIEPLEEPSKKFNTLFHSDQNTFLHQFALGPQEQRMDFHVSKQDHSSSLLPIAQAQVDLFPSTGEKEIRQIEVKPLHHILTQPIKPPALLKLDVQGFELEALKGCLKILGQFQYIYVECSFVELYEGQALADEVIAFLDHYGFRLDGVYNLYLSPAGKAVQADMLFSKTK